jgi:hypothetical protein
MAIQVNNQPLRTDKAGRGISMSISAISAVVPSPAVQPASKPVTAAAPAPAASPTDSVTLSPAAQKAPKAADVDHDGDSH